MLIDNRFKGSDVVIGKRMNRSGKAARYAGGFQPWQQMAGQGSVARQVGGKIPVMPAMVSAKSNFISARRGTPDSYGNGIRLSARACEPRHISPWMQCHQLFCQQDFLWTIQGGHIPLLNNLPNCLVHFR